MNPVRDRPNILFCLADDASFPFKSAYDCPWVSTPAFDRIARNGLLLDRLTEEEDPRIIADGTIFERYAYADNRYQNFYSRYLSGAVKLPPWVSDSDVQTSSQ